VDKVKEKAQDNLHSGFLATGICPLDGRRVLKKLPTSSSSDASRNSSALRVFDYLSEMRYSNEGKTRCGRGTKLYVPSGTSIAHFEHNKESDNQPSISTSQKLTSLSAQLDAVIDSLWPARNVRSPNRFSTSPEVMNSSDVTILNTSIFSFEVFSL